MLNGITLIVKNKLAKSHERSLKAFKNIIGSLVFKGLSILTRLMVVPITINYINSERYGIWLTLSSIIVWMSFFNIGLGHGLRNKVAEALALNKVHEAKIYISTGYSIIVIIISIVFLCFFILNPFLNWSTILNVTNSMSGELRSIAVIVFVFFCFQFVLKIINTILLATQEPARVSLLEFLGGILTLTAIYILTVKTSGSLKYLALVSGLIPCLVLTLASLYLFQGKFKKIRPSIKYINFSYMRPLMNLGVKFFIIQISALIIFQTSNIIIVQLFGPESVTKYNIAFKYFSVLTMVWHIILNPFWSAYTDAWEKKDIDWIKGTIKNLQKSWILFIIGTIILLFLSDHIYKIWIGTEIKIPKALSVSLAANVIIISWNAIYVQFINGLGRIKLQLYVGVLGSIILIPMAIYFGNYFGLHGVVFASLALGIINTSWTYLQYKKIINSTASGIWAA